ncbi:hypothetical protein CDL15_Pgr012686 [Punica granatum]|uniref:Uncharacterized protein n=1 Tax=Punica granatum TaxID=22663 RepID=A0A218W963_PUNGR|nr:hypothetical protein CDL15_Pgr012686 [Punica granatum]
MATLLREAAPSSGKIRNPKGRSPLTDSRLPHAANRDLGAPKIVRECPTPPRSTLVTFGSIPVIRVHPDHLGPSRSLRSTLVTFGSIPVIQVHPGPIQLLLIIQVYPGSCIRVHPGHSGPSRSLRSTLVTFGSIPVIQVHPSPIQLLSIIQGTSSHGEAATKRSLGPKRGASHGLWLHPLTEHATKEGQAVSTPFWPTGFPHEDSRPKPGTLFITRQSEANRRTRGHEQREKSTIH